MHKRSGSELTSWRGADSNPMSVAGPEHSMPVEPLSAEEYARLDARYNEYLGHLSEQYPLLRRVASSLGGEDLEGIPVYDHSHNTARLAFAFVEKYLFITAGYAPWWERERIAKKA